MGETLNMKLLSIPFISLVLSAQVMQQPIVNTLPPVAGGTFTLRYTTPWTCTGSSSTTCSASLTGTTISAGDLLGYQCNISGGYITGVSNGGTFVFAPGGSAGSSSAGAQMSEGYILSATAESGTETITFNVSEGGSACAIWDYSYTGTPAFDGANGFVQAASSTTVAVPTFTPSSGSNNDIYMEHAFAPYTPATSITSPFTIFNLSGWGSWAYENNTTTAYGPTWTWSAAQTNVMTDMMAFGFNVTPPANLSFVDFSGSNGTTATLASLTGNTHGLQTELLAENGSCAFTYSTTASAPLTGSTGRLGNGSSYTDSSTTGIAEATGSAASCSWAWGTGGTTALSGSSVTAAINIATTLPSTDTSALDTFSIVGSANSDFIIAQLSGSGTRGVGMECAALTGGQIGFYALTVGSTYHFELQYSAAPQVVATFTNGSPSIGATNSFTSGQPVTFSTSSALPTGFSAGGYYYVISTGLTSSTFEVSSTLNGTAITAGSAGTGTQKVSTGVHNFYIYTGWSSPSSPGTLVHTTSCPNNGTPAEEVYFGDGNSSTVTTGYNLYFDSLLISLDGTNPL